MGLLVGHFGHWVELYGPYRGPFIFLVIFEASRVGQP